MATLLAYNFKPTQPQLLAANVMSMKIVKLNVYQHRRCRMNNVYENKRWVRNASMSYRYIQCFWLAILTEKSRGISVQISSYSHITTIYEQNFKYIRSITLDRRDNMDPMEKIITQKMTTLLAYNTRPTKPQLLAANVMSMK